ncbi:MAG TPA: hypothetical protein VJV78_11915 [Polyangiales bacterium]|nr:hypothetical protein [Polyangiales bacterium]
MTNRADLQRLLDIVGDGIDGDVRERARAELTAELRAQLVALALNRSLWDSVISEQQTKGGKFAWVEQSLAGKGVDVDTAALQRLIDANVDLGALTDVVRSVQVGLLRDVVNLLDDAQSVLGGLGECEIVLRGEPGDGTRIDSLHDGFGDMDPAKRHMAPGSEALRRLTAVPARARREIAEAFPFGENESIVGVVKLWMKHTGESAKAAHAAVSALYENRWDFRERLQSWRRKR